MAQMIRYLHLNKTMPEIDELLLLSGQDVPFPSAQLQIRQPRIKDIAVVGEKDFFAGTGLINFDKDTLDVQDNSVLEKVSNFDIIMTMMQNSNPEARIMRANLVKLLAVLFPRYLIDIQKDKIVLTDIETEIEDDRIREINNENFEEFKEIIEQITCLNLGQQEKKFNAKSKMAQRIAAKLKKGRQKAAQTKGENISSLLGRYVSILSVGEQKDMNKLMEYTMPQIFEEYQRYSLKIQFDMNIEARLAGAKDVDSPKNWMDDLKEESSSAKVF